jgi:type III pantothenate kinase
MNVVVDSGNTYSKIGWFSGNTLIRYEVNLEFDELIKQIKSAPPELLLYSSVSKPLDDFKRALQLDIPVLYLTSSTPVPIKKNYETPHTLGADRIAAAVGAYTLFPNQDIVVIDMGTCITYDLLSSQGIFEGGIISPGVRMRFKAMSSFTKRLPLIEPEGFPDLVGKSTSQAMQSGVMNGLLHEMEGIIDSYKEFSPSCKVIICGGDSTIFESRLKPTIFAVPELVLIGLNRILEYNVALQQN